MPLPPGPLPHPPFSMSWAWFLASDPGWLRARRAAQIGLSVLSTGLVLWLIQSTTGIPARHMSAGVMIAIYGVVTMRGLGRYEHLTMLVMVLVACFCVALASALLPWWRVQAAAFVALVFVAIYARRFGPLWMAAGMAGYISYFLVCLSHTPISQAPAQWLGILVGGLMAELWRTVLLREHPGRVLVNVARALDVQIGLLLQEVEQALRHGMSLRRRDRIFMSLNALPQNFTILENQIDTRGVGDEPIAWDLRQRYFRIELAAMDLTHMVLHKAPKSAQDLGQVVEVEETLLGDGSRTPTGSSANDRFGEAVRRLISVERLEELAVVLAQAQPRREQCGSAPPPAPDRADSTAHPEGGHRLSPPMRQAIQAATACGLAVFGGFFLSSQRWQWAVLAAYVSLAGVQSSGNVLVKGSQRIIGTVGGVLVGIALATLLSGHEVVEMLLLPVFAFLSFYYFQASYTAMIFWLTLGIALVYGLLGYFLPELLVLRLEETLVGSSIGIAVAYLLFRTSTRETVFEASGSFLRTLRQLIGALAKGADRQERLGRLRDLALSFQKVRGNTRPNSGSWGRPVGSASRAILAALSDSRYYASQIALNPDERTDAAAEGAMQQIGGLIARVERSLKGAGAASDDGEAAGSETPIGQEAIQANPWNGLRLSLSAIEAAASRST